MAATDDFPSNSTTTGTVVLDGSPTVGEIETEGDTDWFSISVEAGKIYQIDVRGAATGDGTIANTGMEGIFDLEDQGVGPHWGAPWGRGGLDGNIRLFFRAPATTTYFIVVWQGHENELGTYSVSLKTPDYAWVPTEGSWAGIIDHPDWPEFYWSPPDNLFPMDVNGDGYLDLVIYPYVPSDGTNLPPDHFNDMIVGVFINDGQGGYDLDDTEIFGGSRIHTVGPRKTEIADFNGDGMDDIFLSVAADFASTQQNGLILSDGKGKMVDATGTLPQRDDFAHGSSHGDIDGDGDVDIFVATPPNGSGWDTNSYFLINDGKGFFNIDFLHARSPIEPNTAQGTMNSAILFDADADGDFDLLMGDVAGAQKMDGDIPVKDLLLLLNDGSGQYTKAAENAVPEPDLLNHAALDLQAHDLNLDGFLDLVIYYSTDQADKSYIQILINNGDGTFTDETNVRIDQPPEIVLPNYMFFQDYDGDGDVDIQLEYLFWKNNGSGFFTFSEDLSGPISAEPTGEDLGPLTLDFWTSMEEHRFADFDGDNVLEVFGGHPELGLTIVRTLGNEFPKPSHVNFPGTAQRDYFTGTTTDNVINGLGGDDLLDGGPFGNDTISGGEGNDRLLGRAGNDQLNGGPGDDVIFGGSGDDLIRGGPGNNVLLGGMGNDTYVVTTADLTDHTVITDSSGSADALKFEGFDISEVSSVSKGVNSELILTFVSGGSISLTRQMIQDDFHIENLILDNMQYQLVSRPEFSIGNIRDVFELITEDGFE